jgi:hypothetical protein
MISNFARSFVIVQLSPSRIPIAIQSFNAQITFILSSILPSGTKESQSAKLMNYLSLTTFRIILSRLFHAEANSQISD